MFSDTVSLAAVAYFAYRQTRQTSQPQSKWPQTESRRRITVHIDVIFGAQGCISSGILVSGIRARGVSSEHMENMEMFSCSPTYVRSDSQRT